MAITHAVQLYTKNGRLEATVDVQVVQWPPDLIEWGTRRFVLSGGRYAEATVIAQATGISEPHVDTPA